MRKDAIPNEQMERFVGPNYLKEQANYVERLKGPPRREVTGYHANGTADPPYADVFYTGPRLAP